MVAKRRSKGRPKRDRRRIRKAAQAPSIEISVRATVLDHLRDLDRERDPQLIEHMVSALLGFALNLDRNAEAEFQNRLRATLVKASSSSSLLYAEGVADQAPADWDITPWLVELRAESAQRPDWASLPELTFLGAWKGTELLGDQDLIILGFQYQDEPAESFQLMIDHNLGLLKDATLLPVPPSELIAKWREHTDEISFQPIASQQAANEIAAALAQSDVLWLDPPWSDDFRAHRGLLRTLLRLLPGPAVVERPEPPDDEFRQVVVAEFMRCAEAANLEDRALSEVVASRLVDFRIDLGDGDVLRWSPIVVEMLLADWYPRKTLPEEGEVELVPDVLRAWIRYTGGRRKLPDALIRETLDAVAEWLPAFENGMVDTSRFGLAKAVVAAMKADGIDVTDSDAMKRWMDDFNRRPFEERAAIIPPLP